MPSVSPYFMDSFERLDSNSSWDSYCDFTLPVGSEGKQPQFAVRRFLEHVVHELSGLNLQFQVSAAGRLESRLVGNYLEETMETPGSKCVHARLRGLLLELSLTPAPPVFESFTNSATTLQKTRTGLGGSFRQLLNRLGLASAISSTLRGSDAPQCRADHERKQFEALQAWLPDRGAFEAACANWLRRRAHSS